MGEQMYFEKTWEEFLDHYSFEDKQEIYTKGAELIPAFRIKQMVEHYFINENMVDKLTIGVDIDDNGSISKIKENLKEVATMIENINDSLDKINEKINIKMLLTTSLLANNHIVYEGDYKNGKSKGGE